MEKMLCVFGVLKTKKGLLVKDRITNYLKDRFDILYIEQEPPGTMYEYPAIKYALQMAIEMNEPVLYIHTKGAADPYHNWYQKPAKQLWEHEFGTDKVCEIYKMLNTNEPMIACPIIGPNNATWFNGKMINPAAAKIILETFHFDKNRYYYEWDMQKDERIKVIGTYYSKPLAVDEKHPSIQKIWDNTVKEITKNLPEIDY